MSSSVQQHSAYYEISLSCYAIVPSVPYTPELKAKLEDKFASEPGWSSVEVSQGTDGQLVIKAANIPLQEKTFLNGLNTGDYEKRVIAREPTPIGDEVIAIPRGHLTLAECEQAFSNSVKETRAALVGVFFSAHNELLQQEQAQGTSQQLKPAPQLDTETEAGCGGLYRYNYQELQRLHATEQIEINRESSVKGKKNSVGERRNAAEEGALYYVARDIIYCNPERATNLDAQIAALQKLQPSASREQIGQILNRAIADEMAWLNRELDALDRTIEHRANLWERYDKIHGLKSSAQHSVGPHSSAYHDTPYTTIYQAPLSEQFREKSAARGKIQSISPRKQLLDKLDQQIIDSSDSAAREALSRAQEGKGGAVVGNLLRIDEAVSQVTIPNGREEIPLTYRIGILSELRKTCPDAKIVPPPSASGDWVINGASAEQVNKAFEAYQQNRNPRMTKILLQMDENHSRLNSGNLDAATLSYATDKTVPAAAKGNGAEQIVDLTTQTAAREETGRTMPVLNGTGVAPSQAAPPLAIPNAARGQTTARGAG